MKKYILIPLVFVLVSGLILGGCAAPAPAPAPPPGPAPAPTPAPEKTWLLKMSHHMPDTSGFHIWGHKPWAEDVERLTNGRVKIDIYPMQTLCKGPDSWEAVKSGIADISWAFTGFYPGQFDLMDVITLPFIVPDGKTASRVAWALYQKFPEIQASLADVKPLIVFSTGPYFIFTADKQIKTLEDFKGLKLGVAGAATTEMVKLLGAVPVFVGMPDRYMNLQKGVIDGELLPFEGIIGGRHYEVGKYYTFVSMPGTVHMIVMNKDVWNEMPPDIQEAIMSVSGEAGAIHYGDGVFDRYAREAPETIIEEAGYEMITYTPPEEEIDRLFEVAGKPVWNSWLAKMEDQGYTNAQEILDETVRLVEQYSEK